MPPWPAEARPALVFSGGGARGAFQVGVWAALFEDPRGFAGRLPAVVCGTSAGAINAALLGAGLRPDEMLAFWISLAEDPPVTANAEPLRGLIRSLLELAASEPVRGVAQRRREWTALRRAIPKQPWWTPSGRLAVGLEVMLTGRFDTIGKVLHGMQGNHLLDASALADRLAARLGGRTFRPKVKIAVHTVDVRTGEVVRWASHPLNKRAGADARHYRVVQDFPIEAVAASAAIPVLFNPVAIPDPRGGAMLAWDGGLLVNTPMAPIAALDATHAVPVLVTRDRTDVPESIGTAMDRVADVFLENAYAVDRKLLLERNVRARDSASGFREITLYQPIRPARNDAFDVGSYLHFEPDTLRAMYASGRKAALAWLEAGPHVDSL